VLAEADGTMAEMRTSFLFFLSSFIYLLLAIYLFLSTHFYQQNKGF